MVSYDETVIRNEVRVIGTLARGLYEFLDGLSQDQMETQSACDAWTVRDVAGHLTNRAERQIASMTRGRAGDSAPPAGFTAPSDNMAMSAANADADIEYSRSLGDALIPTFAENYRELHRLLDSFSGDDWRCDCWHPRRGTMTGREYVSPTHPGTSRPRLGHPQRTGLRRSPASRRDTGAAGNVHQLAAVCL